jgi:hypothetical protein
MIEGVKMNLNFVNCVALAKLVDSNRHKAGFYLSYLANEGIIKLFSKCKKTNYEILDKERFAEMVQKLKNGDLE